MRRIIVVVIVLLASVPSIAVAHTTSYTTHVGGVFSWANDRWDAEVYSPKTACMASRRVTVTKNGEFWGQGLTNAEGRAVVTGDDIELSDDVVLIAQRRELPTSGSHKHVCRKATRSI